MSLSASDYDDFTRIMALYKLYYLLTIFDVTTEKVSVQTELIGISVDQRVMTSPCDVKFFSNMTCSQWVITSYHHNLINTHQ